MISYTKQTNEQIPFRSFQTISPYASQSARLDDDGDFRTMRTTMVQITTLNNVKDFLRSLNVKYSNVEIFFVSVPPSLTSTPANQIVLESATATFHCNATGNPAPKIRWIRDGKTVGEEPTLSFETNRNNSGKYWCLAETVMFSTVNASANLDVQCKC